MPAGEAGNERQRRWDDGLRSLWAKETEEKSEEEEISFLGRCTLFNYASALFLWREINNEGKG